MFHHFFAPLSQSLRPHFNLSKSRFETLIVLILGCTHCRTVNLSHVACQFPGSAKISSNYRRLQRFFQHIHLDQAIIAYLLVRLLNLSRSNYIALDRTNWKFGSKDINILVLAIVTRRFKVPLFWEVLNHQGNSSTQQRIALLKRYVKQFGASSIKLLLADREFIGENWVEFLNENNIPFAIRVKTGMQVMLDNNAQFKIETLLKGRRARKKPYIIEARLPQTCLRVQLACKQLASREWLVIMTNSQNPKKALDHYRKRWGIECLFACMKRTGFNLEDTHIYDARKISTMLGIVALAMAWSYRCARARREKVGTHFSHHPLGSQDMFYVGTLKGVGRVYQQTYIDTYSKVAYAKLYTTKTPITAADILNDQVLPFMEEHDLPVLRIMTDRGTEYCGRHDKHDYQLFLAINDIDNTKTKVKPPPNQRHLRTLSQDNLAGVLSGHIPQKSV